MLETYEGSCHCGRVRFPVRADPAMLGERNCSICSKKGKLYLRVSATQFGLLGGANALVAYEFNTQIAKHTF
jgi:hypothetical protein